eukprot:scaffold96261_cov34-Tisochrysis_lutea.AAC.6
MKYLSISTTTPTSPVLSRHPSAHLPVHLDVCVFVRVLQKGQSVEFGHVFPVLVGEGVCDARGRFEEGYRASGSGGSGTNANAQKSASFRGGKQVPPAGTSSLSPTSTSSLRSLVTSHVYSYTPT